MAFDPNTLKETAANAANDTQDSTASFTASDIEQNKVAAICSYLSIAVFFPLLAKKDSPYAQFHAKQGLPLFILEVIYFVLQTVFGFTLYHIVLVGTIVSIVMWVIAAILGLLAVLGIYNVIQGKAKTLPVIGKFIKV